MSYDIFTLPLCCWWPPPLWPPRPPRLCWNDGISGGGGPSSYARPPRSGTLQTSYSKHVQSLRNTFLLHMLLEPNKYTATLWLILRGYHVMETHTRRWIFIAQSFCIVNNCYSLLRLITINCWYQSTINVKYPCWVHMFQIYCQVLQAWLREAYTDLSVM